MTNSQPGEDINTRLDNLDSQLEQLGDEFDLIRTIQDGVRRETRFNSQALARLERNIRELGNISRQLTLNAERDRQQAAEDRQQVAIDRQQAALDRQQAILDRQQAAEDRQQAAIDRKIFQTNIERIWEYLRDRNGGSSTPS